MKPLMTGDDKNLLRQLYAMSETEVKSAERLYYSTQMGLCACGTAIMKK